MGHADGALARWRTLHELVVVACLIRKHGNVPAQRFSDTYAIDPYRALNEFQQFAPSLGLDRIAGSDAREIKMRYKQVRAVYSQEQFQILENNSFWMGKWVCAIKETRI
jgi:hypothetical protein